VGFAGFEAGVSALSILAKYEMTRHGHRKLACLGQAIDVGFARCHGLVSAANFVSSDTLLSSSFARPLITALVGTTLPLII
jgi:hypothetical protein